MKTDKISFATTIIIIGVLVLLGLLGIQYVAAQTATTSDSAASTTPEVPAVPEAPSAATTDVGIAAGSETSTPDTPPADTTQPAPAQTSAPVETPGITVAARDEIAGLEETYRRQTGKYLQILPGNILPAYESGAVSEKLGKAVPDTMRIDIYEAPQGRGYQITYEENGTLYSIGYGPEAAARTYTIKLPTPVATSTTPVI